MPKKPKKDAMITLTQAAEMSGFAVAYLQKLAQRGRLKCRKFGNLWVTTPADLEEFIHTRVVCGAYRKDIK